MYSGHNVEMQPMFWRNWTDSGCPDMTRTVQLQEMEKITAFSFLY